MHRLGTFAVTGLALFGVSGPLVAGLGEPIGPAGTIVVSSIRLVDNGDNDGFADPNETVQLFLTLRNASSVGQDGIVVQLSSEDPTVDCFINPVISFGSLAAQETRESATPVTFRVANVARASVDADLTASFDLRISGDGFAAVVRPRGVVVEVDLNVSGGLLSTSYTEGFEAAGFGSFTTQSLDFGRESMLASDGFRCQYNDPDFVNSSSYGNTFCFLGAFPAAQNSYDWHVHGAASPDGGRAYLGNNALHWGRHPGAASQDTTGLKQLDAIRTTLPVNLGWNGVTSELSFKHQVGLTDSWYTGFNPHPAAVDRGIVQIQLANSSGVAVGNWRNISPYENLYDSQAIDPGQGGNCIFDPTDDGSDEDDYFDPTDTGRRLGPSSTCAPEFAFTRHGGILFSSTFDADDIGNASHGPGLQGSLGPGTWIESKFSLARWRGRRLRIRFLTTSVEVGNTITIGQALDWNPTPADDGWYIDDVRVTNTLTAPATLSVDTADRTGLPDCSGVCVSVTGSLGATPSTTTAPGEPTELDASATFANGCANGVLQFRFWIDDGDGIVGDAGDVLLKNWTGDPILPDAPSVTTQYGVEARCSLMATCADTATALVTVPCAGTGIAPFGQTIEFVTKTQIAWGTPTRVDVMRGDLEDLLSTGGRFGLTIPFCVTNDVYTNSTTAQFVSPGDGDFYLVRSTGPSPFCAALRSWSTGAASEVPGIDGDRDTAIPSSICP